MENRLIFLLSLLLLDVFCDQTYYEHQRHMGHDEHTSNLMSKLLKNDTTFGKNEESRGADVLNILGGTLADPKTFPWMVRFQIGGNHFCGGALITTQHVLTASHCFRIGHNSKTEAYIGTSTEAEDEPFKRSVARVLNHPRLDLAVVQLSSDIDIDNETAVNLAYLPEQEYETLEGPCFAAGYGRTIQGLEIHSNRLFRADLNIIDSLEGVNKILHQMDDPKLNQEDYIYTTCKDQCIAFGDSGTPLHFIGDSGETEIGGVAHAFLYDSEDPLLRPKCCIFVRVDRNLDWIKSKIGNAELRQVH